MLATRTVISVCVGFVTSRLVLNTLGIESYGVWVAVTALVALLDSMNVTMAGAVSRFMAMSLGRKDAPEAMGYFRAALKIHCVIAFAIVSLASTLGVMYVEHVMAIPPALRGTAVEVFMITAATAVMVTLRTPLIAWLMAAERFKAYAIIEIAGIVIRLLFVVGLWLHRGEVVEYAWLLFGLSLLITALFAFAVRPLALCRKATRLGTEALKPMWKYFVADVFGVVSVAFCVQGIVQVVNISRGVTMNTAYAVSMTLITAIVGLVGSLATAMRPKLIKAHSAGKDDEVNSLSQHCALMAIVGYLTFAVPLDLCGEVVLKMWLGTIPPGADVILSALLLVGLFSVVTEVPNMVNHAGGRIRKLALYTGLVYLLIPFVVYIFLVHDTTLWLPFVVMGILYGVIMIISTLTARATVPQWNMGRWYMKTIAGTLLVLAIDVLWTYLAGLWLKGLPLLIVDAAGCASIGWLFIRCFCVQKSKTL